MKFRFCNHPQEVLNKFSEVFSRKTNKHYKDLYVKSCIVNSLDILSSERQLFLTGSRG